jgi:hypothetical protein
MRIELRDINGYNYMISSTKGDVIAAWLQEYIPAIEQASREYRIPWQIFIWPKDNHEAAALKSSYERALMLDGPGLHELAALFEEASRYIETGTRP